MSDLIYISHAPLDGYIEDQTGALSLHPVIVGGGNPAFPAAIRGRYSALGTGFG